MYEQFSIKHRPLTISGLFGQDAIKKQLLARSLSKSWPKAMLFKGPFGTGKTTAAQIVAMAIQCDHLDKEGNPCGTCASCLSIISGKFSRDTLQLDGGAASKKDDVSELLSTINIRPLYDKARVYIIEEADQLSSAAMNALLKISEAPTTNIYFLFLSMSQGGVTGAIQSRCQTYYFKPIGIKDTLYALKKILEDEGLWQTLPKEFKFEGLSAVAENSKGSLREAINLMENCIQGEFYTAKDIQENLNIMSEAMTYQIMNGLLEYTSDETIWSTLATIDPFELYNYLTSVLANAMVYKQTGHLADESKKDSTRRLISYEGFDSLFELLTTYPAFNKPYIRRADLFGALAKFYSLRKTQPVHLKEEIPTRKRMPA